MKNSSTPDGFLNQINQLERVAFDLPPSGIGVITLSRPERLNAFDLQMLAELRSIIWRALMCLGRVWALPSRLLAIPRFGSRARISQKASSWFSC